MRSVADELRSDTYRRVLAMSVAERIALALALGDADAAAYARANGCSEEDARARLAARRHGGRQPSRSAAAD